MKNINNILTCVFCCWIMRTSSKSVVLQNFKKIDLPRPNSQDIKNIPDQIILPGKFIYIS